MAGRVGEVYKYNAGYQTVTTATPEIGYWMKNNGFRLTTQEMNGQQVD
ncbi:MAG: hypothetical protein HS131_13890 [Ignavibacteriales bacterium]|nr:hypothetical protein [Ignavibacteriales bacterium]